MGPQDEPETRQGPLPSDLGGVEEAYQEVARRLGLLQPDEETAILDFDSYLARSAASSGNYPRQASVDLYGISEAGRSLIVAVVMKVSALHRRSWKRTFGAEVQRDPTEVLQNVGPEQQSGLVREAEDLERRQVGKGDRHVVKDHRTELKFFDCHDSQFRWNARDTDDSRLVEPFRCVRETALRAEPCCQS